MPLTLKVALGQTVAKLHGVEANMAAACALSVRAAKKGGRLILLPEGCLTGNALSGPGRQASLPVRPDAFVPLQTVADDHDITICAGFATPMNGKFNMVHAVVRPRQPMLFQRKAVKAETEPAHIAPWPEYDRAAFAVDGVTMVLHICSESGHPRVEAATARAAPRVLLHPSAGSLRAAQLRTDGQPASAAHEGFADECRACVERAAVMARKHRLPRLAANPVGFDGETWWPGNSYAVDAGGNVRLWMMGENRGDRMKADVAVGDIGV